MNLVEQLRTWDEVPDDDAKAFHWLDLKTAEAADLIERQAAQIVELKGRLEVSDDGWDGIACRDETIRLLEIDREALRQKLAKQAAQIESLRQQLAAALAACKLKDEAISDFLKQYPHMTKGYVLDALAIQPDDSALRAWLGEPVAWVASVAGSKILTWVEGPDDDPLYKPKGLK